jgi:hypothetical protein
MARTLTSGQEAERVKDGVKGVWMVVASFDQYGASTTTKRWASRGYTLSANTYEGIIAEGGIDLGMLRVKEQGGLGPVATSTIRLRDEGGESTITDTHVISNDEVYVYFIFPTGSEVEADRIEVFRGVIERNSTRNNVWTLRLKDDSKSELKQIPSKLLDPVTYPFAYSLGAVIPEAFGNHNETPDDLRAGDIVSLAPARMTDKFALKAIASEHQLVATDYIYQWYPQAEKFAQIVNASITDRVITLDDPARITFARPTRTFPGNGYTNWYDCIPPGDSSYVSIDSNNLRVWFSGLPKIGTMTSVSLYIKSSTGVYEWYLYDTTVSDVTPIASSVVAANDVSYPLTLANYEDWSSIANLHLEIRQRWPYPETRIEEASIKIEFDDFLSLVEQEPEIYQTMQGWLDSSEYYKDGSAVVGSGGSVLRNPVYILEALLRGKNLNNLEEAKIDATSFTAAAASRTDWYFDFVMREQVSDQFLDSFCFEAGLMLYSTAGKFHCAAMDKNRTPEHFFIGGYHMPVVGPIDNPMAQQYDLEIEPVNASDIYNEIAIRYGIHPATGAPQRATIASGQFRITGTANTAEAGSTLTDASATFQTDDVVVGEGVYVDNDKLYTVASVVSETVLTLTAVDGGAVSTLSSVSYYLGPNINDLAFSSQQAYKAVNALGGNRQRTFLDDGGYISQFIRDESTAELFKDHCLDWFSQPRDRFTFSLMHDGIRVQPGDFMFLDHPKFKASQRARQVTETAEAVDAVETEIDVTTGKAGLFRVNDYIYLQESNSSPPELMQVSAVDTGNSRITVSRAQCGTKAQTFSTGANIYRLTQKWVVLGVQEMTPDDTRIRIEAQIVPRWYKPIGTVVSPGYPDYDAATDEQRVASGWGTLPNGRVNQLDPESAISYVG